MKDFNRIPLTPRAAYAWQCGFLAAAMNLDREIDNPYRPGRETPIWHTEAKEIWQKGYDAFCYIHLKEIKK